MPNMYEIGTTATRIIRDGVTTKVKYHNTNVVEFSDTEIILNSGGWHTATTKVRMNQTANKFDLGYKVFSVKGSWFVRSRDYDELIPFEDGMKITR